MTFLIRVCLFVICASALFGQEERKSPDTKALVAALGTIATGRVTVESLNRAYGLRGTSSTPEIEATVVKSCAAGLIYLGDQRRYKSMRSSLPNAQLFEHDLVVRCKTCAGKGEITGPCEKCGGQTSAITDPFSGAAGLVGFKGHGKCVAKGCYGGKVQFAGIRGNRVVNCPVCGGSGTCTSCKGTGEAAALCKGCGATGKLNPKKHAFEQSVAFAKAGLELLKAYDADVDKVAHQQALKQAEIDAVKTALAKSSVAGTQKFARLKVEAEKDLKYNDVDQAITESIVIIEGDRGRGTGFLCEYLGKKVVMSNVHVFCGNKRAKLHTVYDGPIEPSSIWLCKDRDIMFYEVKNPKKFTFLKAYDWKETVASNDDIIVMGNSAGGGVVTSLRGKVNGVGPTKIEVDADFISGNSGSPIISYQLGAKVLGIATYATLDPEIDWVKQNTRFAQVRRFGLRFDDLTMADFVRLDGKAYMANLKTVEDLHAFAVIQFQSALKVVFVGGQGFVSIDQYQASAAVKAKAAAIHQRYKRLPQWHRDFSDEGEMAVAILQALEVLPE